MTDSIIYKKNHILVIGSTEPMEIAMVLETALVLISKNEKVVVLDLVSNSNGPLNFFFAEKYRSLKYKLLAGRLKKKIDIINFNFKKKKTHNFEKRIILAAHKAAELEIISLKRDIKPCKICNYRQANKLSNLYLQIYGQFSEYINNISNPCIYVYNGRFLIGNACWEVAKIFNIEIKFLEQIVMNKPGKYWVFEQPVHSMKYRADVINSFVNNYNKNEFHKLKELGDIWFSDRIKGITHNFTSKQTVQYQRMHDGRKLISYFPSSEDELILLSLEDEVWGSQKKIINDLANYFNEVGEIDFTIRLHPNTNHKSVEEVSRLMNFKLEIEGKYRFVKVINFNEQINTYSLIRKSDLVITSGSTVSLETAYLNIPNVLIGNSLYKDLNVAYNPQDLNEFKKEFNTYLVNKNQEIHFQNALKVGIFQSEGGLPYKFIEIDNTGKNISIFQFHINSSKVYTMLIRLDKYFLNSRKKIIHRNSHENQVH
jgi:hypothetical protein